MPLRLRLLTTIVLIIFALAGLIVAACAQGRTTPAPNWTAFTECAQPCWAGILPGVTTVAEAHLRYTATLGLLASPRFYRTRPEAPFRFVVNRVPVSPANPAESPVPVLYVLPISTITVGDLIIRFGPPDRIQSVVVLNGADCNVYLGERCIVFTLIYDRLGLDAATDPLRGRALTPSAPVYNLTFSRDPDYLAYGSDPWRGFGSFTGYRLIVQ